MPITVNKILPLHRHSQTSSTYSDIYNKYSYPLFGYINENRNTSTEVSGQNIKRESTNCLPISGYPVKKIFKNAQKVFSSIFISVLGNSKKKSKATRFNTKIVSALPSVKGYSRTDSFLDRRKMDSQINSAAFNGNSEKMEAFLRLSGLDPNTADLQGYKPILWAAIKGYSDVVKVLLKHPFIDPNVQTPTGETPLHLSLRNGFTDIAIDLLKHPLINTSLQDVNGETPLHISLRKGFTDISRTLLSNSKMKVNLKNSKGITPLMIAAMKGDITNIQKLLQFPTIKINDKDKDGNTALMWASATWQIDAIKLLMERKDLDLIAANKAGLKAFEIAVRSGDFELSTILTGNGQKSQQVLEHIEKQLSLFTATDIKCLLEEGFIPAERPKALQAMRLLTQFGNMTSLNQLQEDLLGYDGGGYSVVSDESATLS